MTTKILLHGHYSCLNRGCEGIIQGTINIIKQFIPDCRITLFSLTPEYDQGIINKNQLPVDIVPLELPLAPRFSPLWAIRSFARKVIHNNISMQDYLHLKYYKDTDIVISIGGDNYTDGYGIADDFLDSLMLAKRLKKKVAIWGSSIGPFKINEQERIDRLKQIDLITVREDLTLNYLNSHNIISNVVRISDPAFLMEPAKPAGWEKPNSKLFVGIGLSSLLASFDLAESENINAHADFANRLIEIHGASVMLVPHVTKYNLSNVDDHTICSRVYEKINNKDKCSILSKDFDAREMKYCISQLDYFIGARTHSTIAAMSSCVPTISVGYSPKATGVNKDILGHENYVISHKDISADNLFQLFLQLMNENEKTKSNIKDNLPTIKDKALSAGKHLSELCR